MKYFSLFLVALLAISLVGSAIAGEKVNILMKTNKGDIELELWPDKAPMSVQNFVDYAKEGYYNGLIFHRVMKGFMIQGGGFDVNMNRKQTKAPIINEATNGLKNERGTISYARTNAINSATSQFFINHVNNTSLDHTAQSFGYAVFGKVTKGMDVVNAIAKVKTKTLPNGMANVPVKPVIMESVTVVE